MQRKPSRSVAVGIMQSLEPRRCGTKIRRVV